MVELAKSFGGDYLDCFACEVDRAEKTVSFTAPSKLQRIGVCHVTGSRILFEAESLTFHKHVGQNFHNLPCIKSIKGTS